MNNFTRKKATAVGTARNKRSKVDVKSFTRKKRDSSKKERRNKRSKVDAYARTGGYMLISIAIYRPK